MLSPCQNRGPLRHSYPNRRGVELEGITHLVRLNDVPRGSPDTSSAKEIDMSELSTIREARRRIEERYRVSPCGTILSPGKFEGEMVYLPYYYDLAMEGRGDMNDDDVVVAFEVLPEEREVFPELGRASEVRLMETDQGFATEVPL